MDWIGNMCVIVTIASADLTDFCTARVFGCVVDIDARRIIFVGLNRPLRIEDSLPRWPPSKIPGAWSFPRDRMSLHDGSCCSQSSSHVPLSGLPCGIAALHHIHTCPSMAAPWAFVCRFVVVAQALTHPLVAVPPVVVRMHPCLLAVACLIHTCPAEAPQAVAHTCACLLTTAPRVRVWSCLVPPTRAGVAPVGNGAPFHSHTSMHEDSTSLASTGEQGVPQPHVGAVAHAAVAPSPCRGGLG